MIVKRNLRWKLILHYTWKNLLFYIFVATVVYWLHHESGRKIAIPFDAIVAFGTALAIFLGFKNNNAYDRWWEASNWWAKIVNGSRTWAREVLVFVKSTHPDEERAVHALRHRLIRRHIAYVHSLGVYLRRKWNYGPDPALPPSSVDNRYEDARAFLEATEFTALANSENPPDYLLRKQAGDLRTAMDRDWVSDYCFVRLEELLADLTEAQCGCERIKSTPFPRHYSYYSRMFVFIQSILLPLAFVEDMGWAMIPVTTLISFIFCSLDRIGERTEDPFENRLEDVPITMVCVSIERDLREQLGDRNVPRRAWSDAVVL